MLKFRTATKAGQKKQPKQTEKQPRAAPSVGWEKFAYNVAWRWNFPGDKPRTHAPVATLEYMAEKAAWQAMNLEGFAGDLEDWVAEVQRQSTKIISSGVQPK